MQLTATKKWGFAESLRANPICCRFCFPSEPFHKV